jgi:hypothetical protein
VHLAMATHLVLPSAVSYSVGTPKGLVLAHEGMSFAAQYPTRTFPCQRFALVLTDDDA